MMEGSKSRRASCWRVYVRRIDLMRGRSWRDRLGDEDRFKHTLLLA